MVNGVSTSTLGDLVGTPTASEYEEKNTYILNWFSFLQNLYFRIVFPKIENKFILGEVVCSSNIYLHVNYYSLMYLCQLR